MHDPRYFPAYQLLFAMVCAVVDHTDEVVIKTIWTNNGAIFTIVVHPDDSGKIIGVRGRMAESLRFVIGAIGVKLQQKFVVTFEA